MTEQEFVDGFTGCKTLDDIEKFFSHPAFYERPEITERVIAHAKEELLSRNNNDIYMKYMPDIKDINSQDFFNYVFNMSDEHSEIDALPEDRRAIVDKMKQELRENQAEIAVWSRVLLVANKNSAHSQTIEELRAELNMPLLGEE